MVMQNHLVNFDDVYQQEFQVSGHSKALTCVGFSDYSVLQEACFLCTASEDTIVLWDLIDARTAYHKGKKAFTQSFDINGYCDT